MNISMAQKWELAGDYSVEIWFRIAKDDDGYPQSKDWEQLLARPVLERDDYFQIESIPFYLKNVSRGDIVQADVVENKEIQDGEIFQFQGVIDRAGHNTYRLLLRKKHPNDPEFTTNELLKKVWPLNNMEISLLLMSPHRWTRQQLMTAFVPNAVLVVGRCKTVTCPRW